MVKVVIDNEKGLVQSAGNGLQLKAGATWDKHSYQSQIDTRTHTGNHTMTAADSGRLHIIEGSRTMTLPATKVGRSYSFLVSGAGTLTLNPNASDKIVGAGNAGTDDKDFLLSGDGSFIRIVGDGDVGWEIVEVAGTFSRES